MLIISVFFSWNLAEGDLFVMQGLTQQKFYHAVPPQKSVKRARFNLNFRRIILSNGQDVALRGHTTYYKYCVTGDDPEWKAKAKTFKQIEPNETKDIASFFRSKPKQESAISVSVKSWKEAKKDAMEVRMEVFCKEQGISPDLEIDEENDITCDHVVVTRDEKPIATARLLPSAHIGRMCVIKKERGQGIASKMLKVIEQRARDNGMKKLWLNSQQSAISFYLKHGYIPEGDAFQEAGIQHQKMSKTI